MGFLSMPHSCITRQFVDLISSFSSSVIENDVKVNIMPFRTLSSIEFQGSCSRDLNLGQSENSIFGIYDKYSFCRCLTGTSLALSGEVKSRFLQLSNRKNVKVNIMPFRTLSSIAFQGSCSRDLNLGQSENCIYGIYDQYSFCRCLIRTSLELSGEVKTRFFQLSNRKNVKVNIMRFRVLCSIEFQGLFLQKREFITV